MKTQILRRIQVLLILFIAAVSFMSCEKESIAEDSLTADDINMLLYVLEEEKMARDVYYAFDDMWSLRQFSNIKEAEQRHMDLIVSLLDSYEIPYSIRTEGTFAYEELKTAYDTYLNKGSNGPEEALLVGAKIEELDIRDLRSFIDQTSTATVIEAFERLECASGNHLRSFVKALNQLGVDYSPQILTVGLYDEIQSHQQGHCN